jgi:hypothetical protein
MNYTPKYTKDFNVHRGNDDYENKEHFQNLKWEKDCFVRRNYKIDALENNSK